MVHKILIAICIINIIALISHKDYLYIGGWICCLIVTVSDLHKTKEIKSLKEYQHY